MGIKKIKTTEASNFSEFSETNNSGHVHDFKVYNLTRDIAGEVGDVAEGVRKKGEKRKKKGRFPKKLVALGAAAAAGYGANKAAKRHIRGTLLKASAAQKAGDRKKAKELRNSKGMNIAKAIYKYSKQPVGLVDKGLKVGRETLLGRPETKRERAQIERKKAKKQGQEMAKRRKKMAKEYKSEMDARIKAKGAETAMKVEGTGVKKDLEREVKRRVAEGKERKESTGGRPAPGKGIKARWGQFRRFMTKKRKLPFT